MGYIRLFLAIVVVYVHTTWQHGEWGSRAVWSFYCISGFFITSALQTSYKDRFAAFWLNRLLRLYPIYLACYLLTAFWKAVTFGGVFLTLADFPAIAMIDLSKYITSLDSALGVSWTITMELLFYGLMSLGLSANPKRCIIWVVLSALFVVTPYPQSWYFTPLFASLPFAIGASAYWMGVKVPRDRGLCAVAGALSYPVYLSHHVARESISSSFPLQSGWALFFLTLLFSLLISWALVWLEGRYIEPIRDRVRA